MPCWIVFPFCSQHSLQSFPRSWRVPLGCRLLIADTPFCCCKTKCPPWTTFKCLPKGERMLRTEPRSGDILVSLDLLPSCFRAPSCLLEMREIQSVSFAKPWCVGMHAGERGGWEAGLCFLVGLVGWWLVVVFLWYNFFCRLSNAVRMSASKWLAKWYGLFDVSLRSVVNAGVSNESNRIRRLRASGRLVKQIEIK